MSYVESSFDTRWPRALPGPNNLSQMPYSPQLAWVHWGRQYLSRVQKSVVCRSSQSSPGSPGTYLLADRGLSLVRRQRRGIRASARRPRAAPCLSRLLTSHQATRQRPHEDASTTERSAQRCSRYPTGSIDIIRVPLVRNPGSTLADLSRLRRNSPVIHKSTVQSEICTTTRMFRIGHRRPGRKLNAVAFQGALHCRA